MAHIKQQYMRGKLTALTRHNGNPLPGNISLVRSWSAAH